MTTEPNWKNKAVQELARAVLKFCSYLSPKYSVVLPHRHISEAFGPGANPNNKWFRENMLIKVKAHEKGKTAARYVRNDSAYEYVKSKVKLAEMSTNEFISHINSYVEEAAATPEILALMEQEDTARVARALAVKKLHDIELAGQEKIFSALPPRRSEWYWTGTAAEMKMRNSRPTAKISESDVPY